MTQGLKSSEFWVSMLGAAVAFGNATSGWGYTVEELLAILGPAAAYVLSRGLAKADG